MYDEKFMRRAIELSAQALATPGARPYGAVVVKDGKIVGEGLNQSAKNFDPTSHGEVEAVRDACRNLKTTDLTGCDLYTSCEPCSVCVATMIMAGVSRIYYGASLEQSAAVVPRPPLPPPTTLVRQQVGLPVEKRDMLPAETKLSSEAIAVLEAWVSKQKT
ncbi:MAG: guanine deaminase [Hyphomicrobiales bacterium]|jgi:tRNA(Arg) A34 adenosine deaminase TadA|nr:guanine deaminase [Hyphomicrobiales bacterium]